MSINSYNNDRPSAHDVDYASDPASGSFFNTEFKKHEDLKQMLDSNKDGLKLEAMKRIIGMVAKGRDASDLFPAVVKNVVSSNLEVKKLVYVYLVRYAEEQQDLALLSISTFQRALKDPNPLIRACALRVLSSIRVPVIVPIMMLAIKETVVDLSPYVRKTTAHAIPKLYSLDPEQKDELIKIIDKLLSDMSTLVVGSTVMAFEEVCPDRIDLIHGNFRKLCCLLVDVEEWGQVVIINMLTRYARTQFLDPNSGIKFDEEDERPFYEEEDERNPKEDIKQMDHDHRLLLTNTKPLLQSRNAAVVLSVAQLYQHIAPQAEVTLVARALVRLLRSKREIQAVVLMNIVSLSTQRKGMFETYLKSFFVRSSDPTHIKVLKLEVMTNLATESNIALILREFQTYISSSDKEFAAATIQAIGRCASNIKEVTDSCLGGLVTLLSNRDELVVGESVVVVRKLLQSETVGHAEIIKHMARLVDKIKMPTARASILWLLGEYCDKVPKIAPDVLRKMAKSFINEADTVKLQIITLATKLYLTNPKQTRLLCQYVYNLAKYDTNYDIRDRARFVRALIFPPQDKEGNRFARQAKKIFLAPKLPPVQQSSFQARDLFQLGTLSHFINARASGYRDLPSFPEVAPDRSVRDPKEPPPSKPSLFMKPQKPVTDKGNSFYSDGSSDDESKETSESTSDSDSDSDSSESGCESTSDESENRDDVDEDDSDEEDNVNKLREEKRKVIRNVDLTSESSDSSDESTEESSSSSDKDSDSEDQMDSNRSFSNTTKVCKDDTAVPSATPKSNLDLLLDLDDLPPALETPILTPSLGGLLSPLTSGSKQDSSSIASMKVASPAFIPITTQEVLNRISGSGLSVSSRFTRSPHLYSPSMVSIELTFTNQSSEEIRDICIGAKRLSGKMTMHDFSTIPSLSEGSSLHATIGVDFCDSIQPVNFDLVANGKTVGVSITPPVGELVNPIIMSEADFNSNQSKLKGMNEHTGIVEVSSSSSLSNIRLLTDCIYQSVNVLQVPSSEEKVIKFSGQTSSSKSLVLISVSEVNHENHSKVTINCEKMIVASMLYKQLGTAFTK